MSISFYLCIFGWNFWVSCGGLLKLRYFCNLLIGEILKKGYVSFCNIIVDDVDLI